MHAGGSGASHAGCPERQALGPAKLRGRVDRLRDCRNVEKAARNLLGIETVGDVKTVKKMKEVHPILQERMVGS